MRVIAPSAVDQMEGEWEELTGPFPTLYQAEQYVDDPPRELSKKPPDAVTIRETAFGFVVFYLETRK